MENKIVILVQVDPPVDKRTRRSNPAVEAVIAILSLVIGIGSSI